MKTINETDNEFICDIQTPCFQMLTPDEVELVKGGKTQIHFRKGDNLSKQGAFASYVLFVITGYARQYLENEVSSDYNLRIIRPGDFIGLSVVFSKNTFLYSSVAITDCQVFLIEKDIISEIVKKNSLFAFQIIKRYCEQNADLFKVIQNLNYKQMNGKLADTLLYLNSLKNENNEIFQLLSRKDIAEFSGMSTESVVKLLKAFEKDGLLELNEKDIIIKDHAALQDISKRG